MHRVRKIIIDVILIGLLITVFMATTGFRLIPTQAHEYTEARNHYGPSEIIEVFDYGDYKTMLCRYKNWVSCDKIFREYLLFWSSQMYSSFENDTSEALVYRGGIGTGTNIIYGIVNDKNIKKVEIQVDGMDSLTQEGFHDDLFYFSWESESGEPKIDKIVGYDNNGNILCEYTMI